MKTLFIRAVLAAALIAGIAGSASAAPSLGNSGLIASAVFTSGDAPAELQQVWYHYTPPVMHCPPPHHTYYSPYHGA